jgi:hypothetical protein
MGQAPLDTRWLPVRLTFKFVRPKEVKFRPAVNTADVLDRP